MVEPNRNFSMNTFLKNSKNIICAGLLTITLYGCHNGNPEFDDFDYTASYFPWQYPVRTIILGDVSDYDNSNDKQHQFLISAAMGGVYENKQDRKVDVLYDPSLLNNMYFSEDNPVKLLPESYYTLSSSSQITIPSGKMNGGIMVKLTDAFFEDPLSYEKSYVLPFRILSASTDSVLRGSSNGTTDYPDPRVPGHWSVSPKDFTLFCVKYINEYHGNYLLRGKATITDKNTGEVNTVVYHTDYVEKDIVTPLETKGLHRLMYQRPLPAPGGSSSPGNYQATITVDDKGSCVMSDYNPNNEIEISGAGQFIPNGDSWGEKPRNVFHLNIDIKMDDKLYKITDTLVFRDNTVKREDFSYVIK